MSTSLLTIVSDIKIFLLNGIQSFPLTMAGTMLILGFITANYAMLFFLLGLLVIAPLIAFPFNYILSSYVPPSSDVCNLVMDFDMSILTGTSSPGTGTFLPYWIVMTSFFLGYMFTNALDIFSMAPASPDSDPAATQKTNLRQSQTVIGMAMIALILLVLMGFRFFYSGCDANGGLSVTGAVLGLIGGSALGAGWYKTLSGTGQGRLADVFGIANRLMAPSSLKDNPVGCVPVS